MTNILQPTEQTKDSYNQTSEACGQGRLNNFGGLRRKF